MSALNDQPVPPGVSRIILAADERHPRYSEADVIELADGRLLLAVGRKDGASDFAAGTIVGMYSHDGGLSWDADELHVIRAPWPGMVDLMSVSFCRTPRGVHLFFLGRGKDAKGDTRPYMMLSADEGKTWSEPQLVAQRPGYHVVNNARVIRTSKGRLLVPAAYVERIDKNYDGQSTLVLYSDDAGVTWRESNVLSLDGKPLMEPGVAECADGSVYMTIRTALGVLYEARSRDGGATWGELAPTTLPSPAAPSTVVRAPDSDELWMFWCDNAKAKWKDRTPQVFARSRDRGKTWSEPRVVEHAAKHGYGYISFTRVKDHALLTYYDWEDRGQGGFHMTSLRQRLVPLAWFRGEPVPPVFREAGERPGANAAPDARANLAFHACDDLRGFDDGEANLFVCGIRSFRRNGFHVGIVTAFHLAGGMFVGQWAWSHNGVNWARANTPCTVMHYPGKSDGREIRFGDVSIDGDDVVLTSEALGRTAVALRDLDAWLAMLPQP